jgi:hypothetical protein
MNNMAKGSLISQLRLGGTGFVQFGGMGVGAQQASRPL